MVVTAVYLQGTSGSGRGSVDVSPRKRFSMTSDEIKHMGSPIPGIVELPA